MVDPQANVQSYLWLMALVALLRAINATVTLGFIVLVNLGLNQFWEQAAEASSLDSRLFPFLACTPGIRLRWAEYLAL
jgi:hypothetical protein